MKKRFLKDYDQYLNEHFAVFFNRDEQISKFDTVTEEEETTKGSECDCGKKECDCDKKTEEESETTESEKATSKDKDGKKDKDEKKDKDGKKDKKKGKTSESEEELDIKTDIESDGELDGNTIPETEEGDDDNSETETNDNSGLTDIATSYDPTSTSPRELSVVRIMTNNGEKIMMCYTCDADDYTSVSDNLDFKSACNKVKQECEESGLAEFDNKNDTNLGGIPSYMMIKKPNEENGTTSYRPQ